MKIRMLIVPAGIALLGINGAAFAQSTPDPQPAAPAEQQPAAEQEAEDQAPTVTATSADPIAAAEKARDDAKKAAATAPPRTAEQAAIAQAIARSAPEREWRTAALGPAQKSTVMHSLDAKKISDVSIIASVDQRNRLELLDITTDHGASTVRSMASGPKFTSGSSADAPQAIDEAPTGVAAANSASGSPDAADQTTPASAPEAEQPAPDTPQD